MRGRLTTEETHAADHEDRDAALAAFGLRVEDEAPALPVFHLWPDHVPAFKLWIAGQRHRVHSAMGAVLSIDRSALEADIRRTGLVRLPLSPRRRAGVWQDFAVLERAALEEWRRERERAA